MGNVIHTIKPLPVETIEGSLQIPGPAFGNLLQAGQSQGWAFVAAVTLFDPATNASRPFGVFIHDAPSAGEAAPQFEVHQGSDHASN